MKAVIVLSALIACAVANGYGGGYETSQYAAPIVTKVVNVNSGQSWQYRKQDGWGNYAFGYDERHTDPWGSSGGSSRDEKGDAWGNKQGSYSLNVGDGRERVVKYTADGAGFRASIKTNEPGIVASNPAAVNINTPSGYGQSSYQVPIAHTTTQVGGYSEQIQAGGYGGGEAASYGSSGY